MTVRILQGDCREVLKTLPDESVNCVVTSPPYWGLRDYGVGGQLGLESTPDQYVARMVEVFREVRRVLRDDGTVWINLGDTYVGGGRGGDTNGKSTLVGTQTSQDANKVCESFKGGGALKPKDLVGIPWRVAFALQADGWYLRQDIIWHKPNPMPESVTDRCTKAHEYMFLLSKSARYYYDVEAVKEEAAYAGQIRGGSTNRYEQNNAGMDNRVYDTRNRRSVWTVATQPYGGAHFATFPPALIEPCILAGCPEGGIVLDPFSGSGTTGAVAARNSCRYIGLELNKEYIELSLQRFTHRRLF